MTDGCPSCGSSLTPSAGHHGVKCFECGGLFDTPTSGFETLADRLGLEADDVQDAEARPDCPWGYTD